MNGIKTYDNKNKILNTRSKNNLFKLEKNAVDMNIFMITETYLNESASVSLKGI